MSERVVRMDLASGDVRVIPLEMALAELSGNFSDLYSEIAPRLREGETMRLPDGLAYRAASVLAEQALDVMPVEIAS